ncbi:MAG: type II-A CRISPR-associated protein Csn2 [Clostridia bacterium]|nr:type II-A CRISPR-associated protein Csn2 [Clostridia bacterium]
MKGEIKIAHVHLETPLILTDGCVQLLVVENPNEFYSMITDLVEQFDGAEGAFVFSQNGKIIDAAKYGTIISNLFQFDFNDKKLLTLLQKRLEEVAFGEKISLFNELSAKTIEFLGELAFFVPFALDYSEPQPIDYLKAAGVKFEKSYDSLEEKLICYINALIELKKSEFFVFINLKSVLDDKRLLNIYEHCFREQIGLLLIERGKFRPLLPAERAVIITEDLCEILENY